MTVDCAYYANGVRQPLAPTTLAEAAETPHRGGHYLWIELDEPAPGVMEDLCRHFDLHQLAVEDAAQAHQRPKVEAYDGFHLVIYKTTRWSAERREVEVGELAIFVGAGYVIVVRHGATPGAARARKRLEAHPELSKTGPAAAVWSILDVVVDDYFPVVEGLEDEVEELELAVFDGRDDLTERSYQLKQQLNEIYRAVHPLLPPLESIEGGAFPQIDPGLKRYFRDIADHVRLLQDEVLGLREQLSNALEANFALMGVRQNEITAQQNQTVKQLTIIATVFLPLTFVTGFFGQNFGWLVDQISSPAAFAILGLGGLLLPAAALYVWFRRTGLAQR